MGCAHLRGHHAAIAGRGKSARRLLLASAGHAGLPFCASCTRKTAPIQIEDRFRERARRRNTSSRTSPASRRDYLLRETEVTSVDNTIRAVRPDTESCRLLQIEETQPCLLLDRRTWRDEVPATQPLSLSGRPLPPAQRAPGGEPGEIGNDVSRVAAIAEEGSMRHYMERLRARGDLMVVDREIDPAHGLAAVTSAAQKRWGKAVLFTNVKGTRFPVLTNIYGPRERLAELIGIHPGDFCRQWSNLANLGAASRKPTGSRDAGARRLQAQRPAADHLFQIATARPISPPPCSCAKDPETGVGNLSFHRSMYISDEELRCRLAPRHHLTIYHEKAEKMGKPLEAAMLIGPPPTAFLTAAAPLPYDVDEMEVAARLAGRPIPMRTCAATSISKCRPKPRW